MKNCKFIYLFLCCFILTTFCFAEEPENISESLDEYETFYYGSNTDFTEEQENVSESFVENETFYYETTTETIPIISENYDFSDNLTNIVEHYPDIDFSPISDVSIRSVNPITPSGTSGLKSALLSVLGNYDAIVVEYAYQSAQGYTSYVREIQPDYVWLCACAILLITIFSLFKFVGGLFSGKR